MEQLTTTRRNECRAKFSGARPRDDRERVFAVRRDRLTFGMMLGFRYFQLVLFVRITRDPEISS